MQQRTCKEFTALASGGWTEVGSKIDPNAHVGLDRPITEGGPMDPRNDRTADDDLDPGAYIGNRPELEAETIPGGLEPEDERVAAYDSRPGAPGEPPDEPSTSAGEDR
ncbi:MAG TPA: hypothetical protein VGO15_00900 [Candidatus Limnocylindrales bacterium]|jgi:hypothetical protein|nr:hypothetical protein [Candidatus Limnocylindrales bacterium]